MSNDSCARAGREDVKIAFHAFGVYEDVSILAGKGKALVGMGYQVTADNALVSLFTIAADSLHGRSVEVHCQIQASKWPLDSDTNMLI